MLQGHFVQYFEALHILLGNFLCIASLLITDGDGVISNASFYSLVQWLRRRPLCEVLFSYEDICSLRSISIMLFHCWWFMLIVSIIWCFWLMLIV
jgi:hypothetical protein